MFSSFYYYYKVSFSETTKGTISVDYDTHVPFYNLLHRYIYNNYNLEIESPFSFADELGSRFASITGQSLFLKDLFTALFVNISVFRKDDYPFFIDVVRVQNNTDDFHGFRYAFNMPESLAKAPSFITPESTYGTGYFNTEDGQMLVGYKAQLLSYNYEPAILVTWIPPLVRNLLSLFYQDVLLYYKNTERNLNQEIITSLEKLIALFTE